MRHERLRWLFDTSQPILIEDASWREKRAQVQTLPHWFIEPDDDIKEYFAWVRADGPAPADLNAIPWERIREHLKVDFIAFLWHACFFKERDPPRKLLRATPNVSQLIIAWRFQVLIHKEVPVRLDLLKERQGGFSWLFTQMVGWMVCFRENHAAVQVAQDKDTTRKIFRYLKDLHEQLPAEIRPADEYSTRTELVLREKRDERLKGNIGLDSTVDVGTAGNDYVGSGQPIQVAHVSEVGKWHTVCDPEIVYGSAVNAIQALPGTFIARESTAHGANTYWHLEWKASMKIGREGWNGHTPIFLPWYLDDRNALKAPPDMQLSQREDSEFGNEVEEQRRYGLTNEQLEWRRRNIEKQPEGRRKLDIFRQEHPRSSQAEAWLNAFGKWLEPDLVTKLRVRINVEREQALLAATFFGDITAHRDMGPALEYLREGENENEWLRRRRTGPLTIFRLPDWHYDYIVGCDLAENVGQDSTCVKVYQRVGSPKDVGAKMRLACEWYGHADDDVVADILWRLGHFYSVGKARDALPAMLAWERTGPGRAIAKWLRKGGKDGNDSYPHSRMYRRHNPEDVRFRIDSSYGISTNRTTKPVMLAEWKRCAREGDLQLTEEDLDEASALVVDERGQVDTQGSDRFMAACMAVYGSLFATLLWGKEKEEKKAPTRDTVAWAVNQEDARRGESRVDMLEQRVFGNEDP